MERRKGGKMKGTVASFKGKKRGRRAYRISDPKWNELANSLQQHFWLESSHLYWSHDNFSHTNSSLSDLLIKFTWYPAALSRLVIVMIYIYIQSKCTFFTCRSPQVCEDVIHKHVWTLLVTIQVLHLTVQHHWNVQLHLSNSSINSVLNPRPQHINSQPSTPDDVSLQTRPRVPETPNRRSAAQKSGDCSKYTRSLLVGYLWLGFDGLIRNFPRAFDPRLVTWFPSMILDAPSKRSLMLFPMSRKEGSRIQQVLTVQLPDIPWHLHSRRISCCTCYYFNNKH